VARETAGKDRPLHYRVYRLNPAGAIVSGDWIEAEDERQARAGLRSCHAATNGG